MNLKRYAVFAALCTVVLAGMTLPASAQNYRAKFTLPYEAQWGAVDLQPGDYTVSLATVGSTPVLELVGNGQIVAILSGPVMLRESTDRGGRLELTEVNGTKVVTKYVAAAAGREFQFAIPKSVTRKGFGTVALKKAVVPVTSGQ